MNKKLLVILPLVLFVGLSAVFAFQLIRGGDNSAVPSALIGAKAASLPLEKIQGVVTPLLNDAFLEKADATTKLFALNIWASWCVPCRAEHPQINKLAEISGVATVGLNYKDKDADAASFLAELGNSYAAVGADRRGRNAIEFGVYGVPETFLIDRDGIIRAKFVGPITGQRLKEEVLPAIAELTK